MKTRFLALLGGAAALLAVSAVPDTAEARRGGHSGGRAHVGSYSGFHHHRGVHYVPVHPRAFNRNYFYAGPRYVDGCAWLRHRAHATGSRHWWQRYQACRTGYYY